MTSKFSFFLLFLSSIITMVSVHSCVTTLDTNAIQVSMQPATLLRTQVPKENVDQVLLAQIPDLSPETLNLLKVSLLQYEHWDFRFVVAPVGSLETHAEARVVYLQSSRQNSLYNLTLVMSTTSATFHAVQDEVTVYDQHEDCYWHWRGLHSGYWCDHWTTSRIECVNRGLNPNEVQLLHQSMLKKFSNTLESVKPVLKISHSEL